MHKFWCKLCRGPTKRTGEHHIWRRLSVRRGIIWTRVCPRCLKRRLEFVRDEARVPMGYSYPNWHTPDMTCWCLQLGKGEP